MIYLAISWYIWIYINDKKGVTSNAQVVLVLYGNNGKSENIKLQRNPDALHSGHCDQFKVDINDIGTPFKLRVTHDKKTPPASWRLEKV